MLSRSNLHLPIGEIKTNTPLPLGESATISKEYKGLLHAGKDKPRKKACNKTLSQLIPFNFCTQKFD
jgi:hypothetical protein